LFDPALAQPADGEEGDVIGGGGGSAEFLDGLIDGIDELAGTHPAGFR
jgi:hypothetical protein